MITARDLLNSNAKHTVFILYKNECKSGKLHFNVRIADEYQDEDVILEEINPANWNISKSLAKYYISPSAYTIASIIDRSRLFRIKFFEFDYADGTLYVHLGLK